MALQMKTRDMLKDGKLRVLYWAWAHLHQRCDNPNDPVYSRYGGRGIGYSKRWRSFDNFFDDMGGDYEAGLTLDRIDNNKNYSKKNCRWASREIQSNNRSTNRIFTINGEKKTLANWCRCVETKPSTIRQRFYGLGWSIEDSIFLKKGDKR